MTSIIKTTFGSGGAPMSPTGSDGPTLAQALRDAADDMAAVRAALGVGAADGSGVMEGLWLAVGTTPSSQITGTGNTTWHVDVEAGKCEVTSVYKAFTATADHDIHTGSYLGSFSVGKSCKAAVVAKNEHGTITIASVKGAVATTGEEVAPTSAEIQTAMGAGHTWCLIGYATINRGGDTSVTESWDNQSRWRSAGLGGKALTSLLTKG